MYVMLRAVKNSSLDKMVVNNCNTESQATSALKLNRNAPRTFKKFRDGEQFGAKTIENSLALYLRVTAKIASEYPVHSPAKVTTSCGTGPFTDTGTLFASGMLGEQNEVQATCIRQVSPWYPS